MRLTLPPHIASARYSHAENVHDAELLGAMLRTLNTLPVATVALVQGPAFGGGVGLVSCCDVCVSVAAATFTLSEVKLGLIPATISPYVVARIGPQVKGVIVVWLRGLFALTHRSLPARAALLPDGGADRQRDGAPRGPGPRGGA